MVIVSLTIAKGLARGSAAAGAARSKAEPCRRCAPERIRWYYDTSTRKLHARCARPDPADAKMTPPRRSRRLALKRISIGDLPPNVLHHILLTAAKTDNLLRFVAA